MHQTKYNVASALLLLLIITLVEPLSNAYPQRFDNVIIRLLGSYMIPVDRDGSVTKMKLVSVHMATLSPLSEMKIL